MNVRPVLIIPGLGGIDGKPVWMLSWFWTRTSCIPVFYPWEWHDREHYADKEARALERIASLKRQYGTVSLIGTSAGGSAALNMFAAHPDLIHKAVTVCARLRRGPMTGWRAFPRLSRSSMSFGESVAAFEDGRRALLTQPLKRRILTVRARFGDELIPPETAYITGAYNRFVNSGGHVPSILASLTVASRPILDFLSV